MYTQLSNNVYYHTAALRPYFLGEGKGSTVVCVPPSLLLLFPYESISSYFHLLWSAFGQTAHSSVGLFSLSSHSV